MYLFKLLLNVVTTENEALVTVNKFFFLYSVHPVAYLQTILLWLYRLTQLKGCITFNLNETCCDNNNNEELMEGVKTWLISQEIGFLDTGMPKFIP
jgi:hypothetical protein